MKVMQKMIGLFLGPYTRRRARGTTIEQVIADLEVTRDEIMPRIDRAQDSVANREAINHFIGIERWAANRILFTLSLRPAATVTSRVPTQFAQGPTDFLEGL